MQDNFRLCYAKGFVGLPRYHDQDNIDTNSDNRVCSKYLMSKHAVQRLYSVGEHWRACLRCA